MKRRSFALLIPLFPFLMPAAPAAAARVPPTLDDHLAYGSDCGSDEALLVVIDATPKGPKVTITRGGVAPGPYETLDVNFAHVSRRLFFKAKTEEGLLEFQGHARPSSLAGLLSDDRGRTRQIALPIAPTPRSGCAGATGDHR